MIRLIYSLIFLCAISLISIWFINNQGQVEINWLGYEISASIGFVIFIISIVTLLVSTIIAVMLNIKSYPSRIKLRIEHNKQKQGIKAITSGLISLSTNDVNSAIKYSKKAKSYLGNSTIVNLLAAQCYTQSGDSKKSQIEYQKMLLNKDTEIIALRSMVNNHINELKYDEALRLLKRTKEIATKDDNWVVTYEINLYEKLHNWHELYDCLLKAEKAKLIDVKDSSRKKFIIKTINNEITEKLLKNTIKTIPGFTPAIIEAIKFYKSNNKKRQAINLCYKSWKNPHPDIAAEYHDLFDDKSKIQRINQIQKLIKHNPKHIESKIALARIYIETSEFEKAKIQLQSILASTEDSKLYRLLAEVDQELGNNNIEWLKKADHAPSPNKWVCKSCLHEENSWQAICISCNEFDSYIWQKPSKIKYLNK